MSKRVSSDPFQEWCDKFNVLVNLARNEDKRVRELTYPSEPLYGWRDGTKNPSIRSSSLRSYHFAMHGPRQMSPEDAAKYFKDLFLEISGGVFFYFVEEWFTARKCVDSDGNEIILISALIGPEETVE